MQVHHHYFTGYWWLATIWPGIMIFDHCDLIAITIENDRDLIECFFETAPPNHDYTTYKVIAKKWITFVCDFLLNQPSLHSVKWSKA